MKLSLKIFIHFIYWLVFLLFSIMFGKTTQTAVLPSLNDITPFILINWVWAVVAFYLFYFYFIRFFEQRRFVIYLICSIISSIVITFLFLPIHKIWIVSIDFLNYQFFLPPMIGTFIIAQCGCLIRGFENWFTNIQLKTELENRNLRNELELLKSQINPHFLFNTLNNIDSLIHSTPKNASDALITLSDMLRYMIYETTPDHVPLNKEMLYIQNFIKLQNLRFRNPQYVRVSFPVDCNNMVIAPMLMIPFIENAFKYSVDKGQFPVIDVALHCNPSQFTFTCTNYYQIEAAQERTGGVGLENVKRRIGLLYPNKHKLTITKENGIFQVELFIQIA